jgi:glutathione-regulated potassium-efflux system ancillary protein KefF
MKTLIIVSHPTPQNSVAINALIREAQQFSDTEIRHLDQLYGANATSFDIAAEQKAHADADRIIYMYPTHWFNTTPTMKAYLNQVWAYGWAFGPGGEALKGKTFCIVTTAGASEFTYSPQGLIQSSMEDVLTPMRASALYVGMNYQPALAFYGAMGLNESQILEIRQRFAELLRNSNDASVQHSLAETEADSQ